MWVMNRLPSAGWCSEWIGHPTLPSILLDPIGGLGFGGEAPRRLRREHLNAEAAVAALDHALSRVCYANDSFA
jgi:hypothetical protein